MPTGRVLSRQTDYDALITQRAIERRVAAASEESDTIRLNRELDRKAGKRDVQRIEEDVDVVRDSVEESDSPLGAASRRLGRIERRLDRIADSVEALHEH